MQVLAPDLLELTRLLSPSVSAVAALVGLALWLFGAHSHRFWLALVMTIAAGLIGLALGREFAVQPLVAGLLLALAAGMLALALTRVALFVLGGLCAVLLGAHRGAGRQRVDLLPRRRPGRHLLLSVVDHRSVQPDGHRP